jgi:tetratricopeptide (TPR) repeat protein
MRLELWLDESGDFVSDHKTFLNPSLVGGVLIEKGKITEESARQIIGKDFIHFNEESGIENLTMLEEVRRNNGEFVIFQNKERVKIIDSDTTYLNVLAEGIIQLLLRLSAIHGDFELDILVATRKNMVKGYGIVPKEEYENRLRERIIVGLARKILTRKNRWNYHIHFDDARKSSRLMLSDGVCNTFLTKTSSKFDSHQKKRIDELYNHLYIFSFFENSVKNEMERWLAEGNISDVIFECYLESNTDFRETYLPIAIKHLSELDEYGQKIQLRFISSKVDTFIKIDRNYEFIRPVLIDMQEELLPWLSEKGIDIPEFNLDIILYLYSLYTHEGSMKANDQDSLFMKQLTYVKDVMTKFEYFNLYKIRRAVNQKNLMDITGSIQDSSKAITILEEMMQLLEIVDEESPRASEETQMFEMLGKAYGTRGQGYSMLIHEDSTNLEKAIYDFDHALKHFTLDVDKERQYLYKSQAYCEGAQFDQAINLLYRACKLTTETDDFCGLLATLKEDEVYRAIFKYHSYFKIMAAAKWYGADVLADQMYESLIKENITIESLQASYRFSHPMQFIFWNMATYLYSKGKEKLAVKYINTAIDICDSHYSGITMKVIQFGMYAEKLLMAHKKGNKQQAEQIRQEMGKRFDDLKEDPIAEIIFEYLEGVQIEDLAGEQRITQLIKLTRCIN